MGSPSKMHHEVRGAIRAFKIAHPEIKFNGLEGSLIKRIVNTNYMIQLRKMDEANRIETNSKRRALFDNVKSEIENGELEVIEFDD